MSRILNIGAGLALTLLGGLLLAYNFFGLVLHLELPAFWRLWPLALGALALWFLLPALLSPKHRSFGALFIPGLPIMAACGVALLANYSAPARIWGTFWPLIIIALGVGLGLAGFYLRVIWMLIPALVVTFIGAALQFCALTGLWVAWSVLWAAAPLAVALALLVISLVKRSLSLFVAASFIGGTSLSVALGLGALLTHQWSAVGIVGGLGLTLAGVVMVGWSLVRTLRPAGPSVHTGEGTGPVTAI